MSLREKRQSVCPQQTRSLRWGAYLTGLTVAVIVKFLFLMIIRAYQWVLSPLLGPRCRFYPTCSAYAHESISRHGILYGGKLAIKR
ncbi:MAG: membrane protein insertion efficiency factor YidD, partial [Thermodesulfobacteriota bacterium]